MNKNEFHDIIRASCNALKLFCNMILNTKIKKVICFAVSGFMCGALLTSFTFSSINKYSKKKSMGGFETPASPVFTASIDENPDEKEIEAALADDDLPLLTYKTYRVKPEDQIGKIAVENNISQDTLISVNNIKSTRTLQIGTYLRIPNIPGILYTVREDGETIEDISKKYEISAEKCSTVNNKALTVSLKSGETLFLPDAQMDQFARAEINGDLFHKPLKARWYLSSRYGWRSSPFNGKRSFHGGSDMACASGTKIYAALAGKVTFTGYNDTYGNYVIIQHHSGYKSLYAHMSSISCQTGDYVTTESVIGRVGSTGMSTGPHLHFAVYKNGKGVDPLSLCK